MTTDTDTVTDSDERDSGVFTPQGLALGIGFGMMFGTTLGIAFDDIGLWLPVGLALGVAFAVAFSRALDDDEQTA